MTHSGDRVPEHDWLREFLADAIRRDLCTNVNCTTCGSGEFRLGFSNAVAGATGQRSLLGIDHGGVRVTAKGLASISPHSEHTWKLESAVRFILYEIWRRVDEETFQRELEVQLNESWAGSVLMRMKSHYARVETARRDHAERQDPALAEKRRNAKRQIRQTKHMERLALKVERDRLWRENQSKSNQ